MAKAPEGAFFSAAQGQSRILSPAQLAESALATAGFLEASNAPKTRETAKAKAALSWAASKASTCAAADKPRWFIKRSCSANFASEMLWAMEILKP
jgi:hypothetical protein